MLCEGIAQCSLSVGELPGCTKHCVDSKHPRFLGSGCCSCYQKTRKGAVCDQMLPEDAPQTALQPRSAIFRLKQQKKAPKEFSRHLAVLFPFSRHGEDVIWNCNLMYGPCAGPLAVRDLVGTGDILNALSGGSDSRWKLSHLCPVMDFCNT